MDAMPYLKALKGSFQFRVPKEASKFSKLASISTTFLAFWNSIGAEEFANIEGKGQSMKTAELGCAFACCFKRDEERES